VLRQIVLVFEDKLFLPGDYVCRYNDSGSEMFFIFKGRCTVLSENHAVLKVMNKGEHFGEVSLLTGQRRTAFVRSNLFSTLASLSKDRFELIMREFPAQLELILEAMSDKQRQWMHRLVQENRKSLTGEEAMKRQSLAAPDGLEDALGADESRRSRHSQARVSTRISMRSVQPVKVKDNEDKAPSHSSSSSSSADSDSDAGSKKDDKSSEGKDEVDPWDRELSEGSDVPAKEDVQVTDLSKFIAMIGKRCHLVLDNQDQICKRLGQVARSQESCTELAKGLTFSVNCDDEARQDRTVMLECVCNDVEVMRRMITETNTYARRNSDVNLQNLSGALGAMNSLNKKNTRDSLHGDIDDEEDSNGLSGRRMSGRSDGVHAVL
jgi:CRP-like cAMP-binding protein